jgi:hypothetical protein
MSLTAAIGHEETRGKVIDDCVQLVDDEVGRKGGLGGMVIKTGYKAVKGIKPGFIRKVVDALFDQWAAELDPLWTEAIESGGSPRSYFEAERSRVADALLKVTDDKSQNAKSAVVKSTYGKLRPTAKKHVEQAVPGLATLLEKYVN